jgi:hypothetical protein
MGALIFTAFKSRSGSVPAIATILQHNKAIRRVSLIRGASYYKKAALLFEKV